MLDCLQHNHSQFITQLSFLGCPEHLREDFVQDMYIKYYEATIDRHIEYPKAFASFILRNMYFDFCKKKKYEVPSDWIENTDIEQDEIDLKQEMEMSKELDELEQAIPEFCKDNFICEVNKDYGVLNGYELSILILHFKDDITMRRLSRESGISLHSIYNTIKQAKQKIKAQINEINNTRTILD